MKFFDFCSGIGGGRLGLEKAGMTCVGNCEIDYEASRTYNIFFEDDRNYGDLTKINPNILPDFDFMIAGFPCQTFSIVGKREGLNDERGQIIYSLINIMKKKNVKYFILENVKGLVNHDRGKTFNIIKSELKRAGYNIYFKILNSIDYGLPQKRERIYIVGYRKDLDNATFNFLKAYSKKANILECLDDENKDYLDIENKTFKNYLINKYNKGKYSIKELLSLENYSIDCRQSDLRKYENCIPTLRKGRHGLLYVRNAKIIKLSGYEALLFQGFPKEIAKKVKNNKVFINNKVLSLAGNAMSVNVIESIAREILKDIQILRVRLNNEADPKLLDSYIRGRVLNV